MEAILLIEAISELRLEVCLLFLFDLKLRIGRHIYCCKVVLMAVMLCSVRTEGNSNPFI
jgi:hypothetical protein